MARPERIEGLDQGGSRGYSLDDDPVLARVTMALSSSGGDFMQVVNSGAYANSTGGQMMNFLATMLARRSETPAPAPAPAPAATTSGDSDGSSTVQAIAGIGAAAIGVTTAVLAAKGGEGKGVETPKAPKKPADPKPADAKKVEPETPPRTEPEVPQDEKSETQPAEQPKGELKAEDVKKAGAAFVQWIGEKVDGAAKVLKGFVTPGAPAGPDDGVKNDQPQTPDPQPEPQPESPVAVDTDIWDQ